MLLSLEEWQHTRERLCGLFREVGTLLVAFAPLDYSMQSGELPRLSLAGFLVAGACLFVLSLLIELRWRQ
jgi:hypothetical protein